MPMPPGIATVTLTGRYIRPDGTPLQGSVSIAAPALITLSGADSLVNGSASVTLNSNGAFSVVLVATDNADMQPTGWAYNVVETMAGFPSRSYSIMLPQATPVVDLADIAPANPADGDYILITGPAGADGRTILSGTADPTSSVGADGDFYINTTSWTIFGPKTSGAWGSGTALSGGGGGGAVDSVNGQTGAVVLDAADVGADPAGSAASAQSAAVASAQTYTDAEIADEVIRADAAYVAVTDPRLTDDRNPSAHASSHAAGGVDELTPAAIGAASASALTSLDGRVTTAEGTLASRQRSAIRRGDIVDLALADPLHSGAAPTITTAQTTTSSISGAIKHAPPLVALSGSDVRGDFLFLGATDFAIGSTSPDTNYALPTSKIPHTYASGQSSWAFEFVTDADVFEMRFKYINSASSYKLCVDGRPLTAYPVSVGGTTAGSGHMLKVAFSGSAVRRIRIDLYNVPFGGIYIGPSYSLWRPVTAGGRLMVLGDSITDGSSQNAGQGVGTWLYRAARMLGVTDAWDQARGGTGYITPGAYATFGDRLSADAVAYSPDVLIIKGGYNDASGSQTAIASAAASLFSAAKSALPNTQIIVAGPISPTASPATSITDTDTTLRTAAQTAGLPYISLVTGETRNGAGTVVSTQSPYVTSANAATVIGADGVHPTDVGHLHLARWMVRALTPILPL